MIESNPYLTSASLYPLSFNLSTLHITKEDSYLTRCSNNHLNVLSLKPTQDSFNIPCYKHLKNGDEIIAIHKRPQFYLPLISHPERKGLRSLVGCFPFNQKVRYSSIDLLTNKWIKAFLYDSLIKENTVSPHTQLVLSIICMPDSTQSLPFDEVREQFNKFNTPCCFQLCTSR